MKHVVTAALVVSLLTGTVATANPPDHHDRRYAEREYSRDRHDDRADHRDNKRDDRRDYRSDSRHDHRYHAGEYRKPHGYYSHSWRRGDRLPSAYRSRVYVVNDYHTYRLRQPPRGYHWVRVDNNVVLTAVATGIVLEVVNDLFR